MEGPETPATRQHSPKMAGTAQTSPTLVLAPGAPSSQPSDVMQTPGTTHVPQTKRAVMSPQDGLPGPSSAGTHGNYNFMNNVYCKRGHFCK